MKAATTILCGSVGVAGLLVGYLAGAATSHQTAAAAQVAAEQHRDEVAVAATELTDTFRDQRWDYLLDGLKLGRLEATDAGLAFVMAKDRGWLEPLEERGVVLEDTAGGAF